VLIRGPYLVRNVSTRGSTLSFTGDINGTTIIDVFAPSRYHSVTWNGASVKVTRSDLGSLRGVIEFPGELEDINIKLPNMAQVGWSCADSLPELASNFDDSDWVLANKTTTKRPQQPFEGKVSISLPKVSKLYYLPAHHCPRTFSTPASESSSITIIY
jgi:hypothetical protein